MLPNPCRFSVPLAFCLLTVSCYLAAAPDAPTLPRGGLALPAVGRYGRLPLPSDALEARFVAGRWKAPQPGDAAPALDGAPRQWDQVEADDKGVFRHASLRGGYLYLPVASDAAKVMILEASGHGMVYVNGEPRTGDPYQHGYVKLPVLLHQGTNDLLFHCGRGQLTAKMTVPAADVIFNTADLTLPTLRVGEEIDCWAAIPVLNATTRPQDQLAVEVVYNSPGTGGPPARTPLPVLPPVSMRKVGVRLTGAAPTHGPGDCAIELRLERREGAEWRTLDTAKVTLGVRASHQKYKKTFVSEIDGSVQYFAVVPPLVDGDLAASATGGTKEHSKPALVLTCHGANVEAEGQAACYAHRKDLYVVAPTNRRAFGFDWEDWGRLDAMEVLDLAEKKFGTDPRRTYLTGHSMGGHGAWHLGVTFPGRFAAIGPSAGWISMWSYAGAPREVGASPLQELVYRAAMPSDTLAMAKNYASCGVFILHGDKDDNVPVDQARQMRKVLADFHPDFAYYERPGAGHWWGNPCVDWPPMFDFFAAHVQPEIKDIRKVQFVTACPGVAAHMHWATIEAQVHALKPSSVQLAWDPAKRHYAGTTENVARLALDIGYAATEGTTDVELDGQKMEKLPWTVPVPCLYFERSGDKWSPASVPSPALKGPHRYGPFKDAFRHRMVFVYGTKGSSAENVWAYAKARFDAETFWYRGNGSVDVIPDTAFDANADRDRNVILYGNAATNGAWKPLLAESPVQVEAGQVRVSDRVETGDNLACLFLRPRPGSDTACVAAVAGTGVAGMRLTNRLPYFTSGIGYPDCLVFDTDTLTKGAAGLRVAGYFGIDWSVKSGEFAWRQ